MEDNFQERNNIVKFHLRKAKPSLNANLPFFRFFKQVCYTTDGENTAKQRNATQRHCSWIHKAKMCTKTLKN